MRGEKQASAVDREAVCAIVEDRGYDAVGVRAFPGRRYYCCTGTAVVAQSPPVVE